MRSLMMVALLGACGDDVDGPAPAAPLFGTERLSFGQTDCGATAAPRTLVISNSGDEAFDYTSVLAGGAASPYTVSPSEGTVGPRSFALLTVTSRAIPRVSAVTANLYGDTLTVTTSVGAEPQTIAIEQTARGAILTAPAAVTFAQAQIVGSAAGTSALALQNVGNADATVTLTSDETSFSVPAPLVVAAGASATPALGFFPLTDGPITGTVHVTTDAPSCGVLPTATASGTGSLAATAAEVLLVGPAQFRKMTSETCVRLTSGHVACMGRDQLGSRGAGEDVNPELSRASLVRTADGGVLDGAVELAGAGAQVCARRTDNSVWCWGNVNSETLKTNGHGIPYAVPQSTGATALAVGYRSACVVSTAGGVVSCRGLPAQNWRDVAMGTWTVSGATDVALYGGGGYALMADGTVTSFGLATRGARGNGDASNSPASPVTGLTDVIAIAGGESRVNGGGGTVGGGCAVKSDGTAWCWGGGRHGRNGNGNPNDLTTPAQVMVDATTPLAGVTAIAAGRNHRCAIATGGVHCWGRGDAGQLGRIAGVDNSFAAPTSPAITNAVQLSTNSRGTCALLATKQVVCWGVSATSSGHVPTAIAAFNPPT